MIRRRWVINPVVVDTDGVRKALSATIPDPGAPPILREDGSRVQPFYDNSSAIGAADFCLTLIAGHDLAPLDRHPDIIRVLDNDDQNLALTPNEQGWDWVRYRQLLALMHRFAVPMNDYNLHRDAPLWQHLEAIGQVFEPSFHPRGTWV